MKAIIRSLLLTILISLPGIFFSQGFYDNFDKIYGLDPLIYNGKKYSYFLPSGTGGTQFLVSDEFVSGEIIIESNGRLKTFGRKEDVRQAGGEFLLNYDVYNQKLLMKYPGEAGAEQIIEVSEAWLKGFSLGAKSFIFMKVDNKGRIFQVLGNGKYKVLYHWRKNFKLANSGGRAVYTFSSALRTSYVLIDGVPSVYGSGNSFTNLFDPRVKDLIREYMKTHRISLKKSSDTEITALINFISNLD